jgi:hypothetical protein
VIRRALSIIEVMIIVAIIAIIAAIAIPNLLEAQKKAEGQKVAEAAPALPQAHPGFTVGGMTTLSRQYPYDDVRAFTLTNIETGQQYLVVQNIQHGLKVVVVPR